MSSKINLSSYQDFVEAVTSDEANKLTPFINRLDELSETTDCNIPLFLNSAIGMAAEGGDRIFRDVDRVSNVKSFV